MSESVWRMPLASWVNPAPPAAAEAQLLTRAQRDPAAFGDLYRVHHDAVAGYIYRRTGDRHATEDLVADVFLTALQYLPRYRCRGLPLRAWLYRLASNRVNRWVRRERSKAPRPLETGAGAIAPDSASGDVNMELALARERVRAALLTLAPKYQTVLALHYLEGMTVEEAALALGCRPGTIKARLHRGRDQLRQRLESRRS
jgi:RNA polymerase sigma-70 factor (ECF subfamily)